VLQCGFQPTLQRGILKAADGTPVFIQYFGDAKTIWESDNPYIYQFIRGLTEGPITKEITYFKDKA
jgi:hypothetical protein